MQKTRLPWLMGPVLWLVTSSLSIAENGLRFSVRPEESRFTVDVGRAGLLKVFGHDHHIEVRRYSGEVVWTPDSKETSSVRLEIEAASLTVVDEHVSDNDKAQIQADMEAKVLEVQKYPVIRFESKSLRLERAQGEAYRATVAGELTLHGVTRAISIPLRFTVTEAMLRATGEIEIKGTDFGIEPVSVAGGAVKTRDEIKLAFDLLATP